MATLYISPAGAGTGDGSSWANAAKLTSLSKLIGKAGGGGEVLIRADQGAYNVTGQISITAGGVDGAPVVIRGVDGAGNPMAAEIVGTRNIAAGVDGGEVFRLLSGANDLTFEQLTFRNIGNGAFRIGADINDLTVRHIDAINVQRFIEDYVSGSNTTASVDGLTVQDVQVFGYSKGVIRLQYDSRDILIQDVLGDSQQQAHDDFAMGVMFDGTVHDAVIRRTIMANNWNTSDSYWNGDGFATEGGTYNIRFENTLSYGNTDGGYDIKSDHVTMDGAWADANKRNFRFWGEDITLVNGIGSNPHKWGGSSSQAQVWLNSGAKATVVNSQFIDGDAKTIVYELSSGSSLTLTNDHVVAAASGALKSVASSAALAGAPAVDAPVQAYVIMGGDLDDRIAGGALNDYLRGGAGNDIIIGGDGFDDINGNMGADTLFGGLGNDWVLGGQDDDIVYGDAGDDFVQGNRGSDTVFGGAGADTVRGGQDSDSLSGGDGNDWLFGDRGADTLSGGKGADVFALTADSGVDRVVDFSFAEGDRIYVGPGVAYQTGVVGADLVVSLTTGEQLVLLGAAGQTQTAGWIIAG